MKPKLWPIGARCAPNGCGHQTTLAPHHHLVNWQSYLYSNIHCPGSCTSPADLPLRPHLLRIPMKLCVVCERNRRQCHYSIWLPSNPCSITIRGIEMVSGKHLIESNHARHDKFCYSWLTQTFWFDFGFKIHLTYKFPDYFSSFYQQPWSPQLHNMIWWWLENDGRLDW